MSALPPKADMCGECVYSKIAFGDSDHKLFNSLHPRSHVRHEPHPVGGVRAFENPDCFVRLRECGIPRRTERRVTTMTLQAYLSRDRIRRHLWLRDYRERPCDRRAPEDRDELAPPHVLPLCPKVTSYNNGDCLLPKPDMCGGDVRFGS
jgi:hypothetical protein